MSIIKAVLTSSWNSIGRVADHHGRISLVVAVITGGWLVFTTVWSLLEGWLRDLPIGLRVGTTVAVGILVLVGVIEGSLWIAGRWKRYRQFGMVAAPSVVEDAIHIAVTNNRATDTFKANVVGAGILPMSALPLSVRWKGIEGEYRQICRTGTEALHVLDYEVVNGTNSPIFRCKVRSALESNEITKEISLTDFFSKEPGVYESSFMLTFAIVGRTTRTARFQLVVRVRWFVAGPIQYQITAHIDPSPYRRPLFAGRNKIREHPATL
jgi:hypothetical protein